MSESEDQFAARVISEARTKAGLDGFRGLVEGTFPTTHTRDCDQGGRSTPCSCSRAKSGLTEGFGIGEVVPESFTAAIDQRFRAEVKRVEAEAREQLVRRVERAIEGIDTTQREALSRLAAEAAVSVFVEFLSNPPVREVWSDGTERVRWPK